MMKLLSIKKVFGGPGLEDHITGGLIGQDGIQEVVMEVMAIGEVEADTILVIGADQGPGVVQEEEEIVADLEVVV
jgi:hypothetical protein